MGRREGGRRFGFCEDQVAAAAAAGGAVGEKDKKKSFGLHFQVHRGMRGGSLPCLFFAHAWARICTISLVPSRSFVGGLVPLNLGFKMEMEILAPRLVILTYFELEREEGEGSVRALI